MFGWPWMLQQPCQTLRVAPIILAVFGSERQECCGGRTQLYWRKMGILAAPEGTVPRSQDPILVSGAAQDIEADGSV